MITLRENQTEPINKAIQFFTEAEFDCSPDRLGKINTDGFCRKEQQR